MPLTPVRVPRRRHPRELGPEALEQQQRLHAFLERDLSANVPPKACSAFSGFAQPVAGPRLPA